jgi:HlyD family secretion protein/epimerase transport system membrane fusion protein
MTIALLEGPWGGTLIRERSAGTATPRPDLRQPILWGMLVLLGFVGGFGTWAAVSPLSSAVVAPGSVVVDTQRKTVQHLEGGIVRDILVREGERVAAGQPLVRLDITRAETIWQEHRGQLIAARAQEERLIAERDGLDAIRFPAALEDEALSDETIHAILQGQQSIFEARRAALSGQRQILSERVGQLRSQIAGFQAQERATLDQSHLIQEELVDIRGLVDKGLERRPRLRALERQAADLVGRLGEYRGNIAKAEQAIGETRLQIIDLDNRRTEEVVADLRETQTRGADL